MVYTADRALKGDAYKLDTVKAGLFITKPLASTQRRPRVYRRNEENEMSVSGIKIGAVYLPCIIHLGVNRGYMTRVARGK